MFTVLELMRASVVLEMSLIAIDPAAAIERPNELPVVSEPAMPKASTSMLVVDEAVTETDEPPTVAF
jgi:hypothetical protein